MRRLPAFLFVLLLSLVAVSSAQAVNPQSGSSTVNASVNNPSQTPTLTPTPTPLIALTATPTPIGGSSGTPTPTLPFGVSPTPTSSPVPGEAFYLDISGFASPHASVVMTSDNVFFRAAVADSKGDFFISQIKVPSGFSQFCLENIDFQRIGDSLTCFRIPPVTASTSKKDIFLPPSLGLSNKKTTPTSFVYGFGYTMPGSKVAVQVSQGINLKTTADKNGYYKVKIENLAVGTYELYAGANYQGKNAEKPSKTQELKSLSPAQAAREQLFTSIWDLIKKYGWLVIPILILVFILLSKKARDKIKTAVRRGRDDLKPAKKPDEHLHHYWFIGY